MTPAAAVSGMLFAHPAARYFAIGRIARDQVEDYAARKGMPVEEAESWLRPNLAYEPPVPGTPVPGTPVPGTPVPGTTAVPG